MSVNRGRDAKRPVRVEDVARLAGVSPITVSRALSSPDRVREETRRKVEEAVEKTGYIVNRFASTLRSGRSSIISVFVPDLRDPQIALAMQGFVDAFEQSDYSIMFTQVRSSGHLAAEDPVGAALPFRPAGIVLGTPINCDRTRAALLSHRTPVVEMWNQTVRRLDMVVEVADHEAGRQLGQHLHAQGYRRIVFCGEAAGPLEVRLAGLKEALSDVGLGLAGEVFADRFAALGEAKGALDAVFANVPDCDAVVMGSDMLSAGALIRAVELGILVPQQLGISGIGGLDRAGLPSHGVTTLAADGYAVGRDAAQMLLRRLEVGDGGEQVRSHEVRLEIGKSTSRI